MTDPITQALKHAYHNIPIQILNVAFEPDSRRISLDDCIMSDVIIDRVLPDTNCLSGKYKTIILNPDWIITSHLPTGYMVPGSSAYNLYRIPAEARENRDISDVISIRYPYSLYSGSVTPFASNPNNPSQMTVGSLACQVLNSQTMQSNIAYPNVHLRRGNIVEIKPISAALTSTFTYELTLRLEFDANYTNLTRDAVIPLADLILCAIKAYCFNTLVLKADEFYSTGGQEMSRFKEIVDSYAEENTKYRELLFEFRGGATSLDADTTYQLIYDAL